MVRVLQQDGEHLEVIIIIIFTIIIVITSINIIWHDHHHRSLTSCDDHHLHPRWLGNPATHGDTALEGHGAVAGVLAGLRLRVLVPVEVRPQEPEELAVLWDTDGDSHGK